MKPVSDEQLRILRAAHEGRLVSNEHGRWVITGEAQRPERRERQRLHGRGMIDYARTASDREDYNQLVATARGVAALAAAGSTG